MVHSQQDMMRLLCAGTKIRIEKPAPSANPPAVNPSAAKEALPEQDGNVNVRKRHKIRVKGSDVPEAYCTFEEMKTVHPKIMKSVLGRLAQSHISTPTPIQMQCIPLLMQKRSVLSCAPTGSGKTLGFALPILSHLKKSKPGNFRALILSPTRELAGQIYREFKSFGGSTKFKYYLLSKANAKSDILSKEATKKDILIATPSYLLSMIKEDKLDLSSLEFCILDEADRLFDTQFKEEILSILECIDLVKVTVGLFSATLANGIDNWCFAHLDNFVQVFIGAVNGANRNIKQSLKFVGTEDSKVYSLRVMIQAGFTPPMLVFTQTKDRAKQLHEELKMVNSRVASIHSDVSQHVREEVVGKFRSGEIWILICTDLMGRGIDFKNVNVVVNFDLPQTRIDYIHRIGRTGRAGQGGEAVTFFTEADKALLPSIISVLKNSGCELPGWLHNLKGVSRRDYKRATRRKVVRKDISTVPRYDVELSKKRKAMIADSKAKKKAKSAEK